MIAAAAKRANAVVCVSAFTARRLTEHVHPRGEVVVVPHGVDHGRFTPAGAGTAADLGLLARHGIAPPYIAFAGTIEPRKDVPTLVRAFARLAPGHPELRLVIAGGDGWGAAATPRPSPKAVTRRGSFVPATSTTTCSPRCSATRPRSRIPRSKKASGCPRSKRSPVAHRS